MSIHLFDVSAYVYTGWFADPNKTRYNIPVGGIQRLMGDVCTALGDVDYVLLAFDSRSFRKDLNANYKAGRQLEPSVICQIDILYTELQALGFPCHKFDGAEADDIIAWACRDFSGTSQAKPFINIYGNDYDLTHNVSEDVRFLSISPARVNNVYHNNMINALNYEVPIRYNTVSAYKVFCGDTSDNYPGIKTASGLNGVALYKRYVKYLDDLREQGKLSWDWEDITSQVNILQFSKELVGQGLLTVQEFKDIFANINLVYPKKRNGEELVLTTKRDIDIYKFIKFLSKYDCKYALENLNVESTRLIPLDDQQKEELKALSNKITSGAYNVSKNIPVFQKISAFNLNSLDNYDEGIE